LPSSLDCAKVPSPLPAGARRITTSWHPDWRMPVQVTEPLRITTTVYNGQGATCSPAPLRADGTPLALVCSQTQQALLANGTPDTAAPPNITSYTYDASGRVLTAKDANNHTTAYAYYSATAFTGTDPDAIGHTVGDLQSITNAVNQVTQFTLYDKAGRVRQSIDSKGVQTDVAYAPRGWVSTVTVTPSGGTARTTSYTYDNAGQLTDVLLPDTTHLHYGYDAAHRLTTITDARGNAVTYTLDNTSNRTAEEVRDPTGTLQRSISRSFDALNRVQQVTGAER